MSYKSIIIIGAGIAGLSAGCYGRMNGFQTRIFEMHKKPGGLCTSWKREGYTINGCIHWLVGSSPTSSFFRLWEELGALRGRSVINHEEYGRIEGADGGKFIVYTDIDRLERHMKGIAPEDIGVIDEFIKAVRRCTSVDPPWEKAPEASGLLDALKMIVRSFPLLRMLLKWNRISLRDFGMRFKNPLLREAFPLLFMPDFPVSFMIMAFAWMHRKAAGYPVGGSLEFARAIEKRYLALGGEVAYRARVRKILTENGRAVGIRLEDGSEHRADYVISAADGHATIFDMLEGKFVDDTIRGYYEKLIPFPPLVHVALGVSRAFDDIPYAAAGLALQLREPITIGGVKQDWLGVHIYNFDPTLAPPGKTMVTVMLPTDYDYWKDLHEDRDRYKGEKEAIADTVVALLDKRFPGLAAQVEMRDVATPTTFVRYTGNWKGSFEGWMVTPETWSFGKIMRKTLPGLENFYMAGQWVEPGGGIPAVAMSGRNVIQIVCKQEKNKFVIRS
ncbi:MAG TPA: NAD(P)/FAD-dependent oxidoreductase [Nitrospirota bacterium]|nr:NAD(P)/FAD-dependent oxidoreductase [Nitrospirota bacterium]